jgi:predicted ArsR family transcriptional regulator
MTFLFGRKSGNFPRNATVRITQQGTEKLQEYSGDPESKILITLESSGTCNIVELAQKTGLSRGHVERILPKLISGGYVQIASTQGAGE